MNCKKFRIIEWILSKTVVYTPQEKDCFIWWDINTGNRHFFRKGDGIRDHVNTKEKALAIIEGVKQRRSDAARFKRERKEAKNKFGKNKIICADE